MDTVRFGRTDLTVSVAALGCGGRSRLGKADGATDEQSMALVRRAVELGVTIVDTAAVYGTEEIVGNALIGRTDVAVSTKIVPRDESGPLSAAGLSRALEESLRRLRRDTVDILHLHGVTPEAYAYCRAELVPEMDRLRDVGKVRYLAVSEASSKDVTHEMLKQAVDDDCWDAIMVAFNILNPSARDHVLPRAAARDVGVLLMCAVRNTLGRPDELRRVVAELSATGNIPAGSVDVTDPLGFLLEDGGAESIVDAAYRFARHEAGPHVVLTGTGSAAHLEQNLASLQRPPLREIDLARLGDLFATVQHPGGGTPERRIPHTSPQCSD